MDTLYPEVKRITKPHGYYVDLTKKLLELKRDLIIKSKKTNIGGKSLTLKP